MTDFTEPPEPPPEPPPPAAPLRTRLRRFAVKLLVVVALLAAAVGLVRRQVGRAGEQRVDALVVQLHASEPGWRIEDIEAERAARKPPPEQNSALVVLDAAGRVPNEWQTSWREAGTWPYQLPEPYLPHPDDVAKLKTAGPPSADARAVAIRVRDLPHGHYPVEFPPDRFALYHLHLGKAHTVADVLEYDAAVAVLLDRDPNRAIRAAYAILNVARSVGDEPTLGAQYTRMTLASAAARVTMQTLAWSEPTDGLAELQAELLKEANEPRLLVAMRGQRANLHRLFHGLRDERFTYASLFESFECHRPPLTRPEVFRAYRPFLPGDHAEMLRRMNAGVAVAKLPPHRQYDAAYALRAEHSDDVRYPITRQFVPHLDQTVMSALTARAALEMAAVGIASERFRQAHDLWPNDPNELVPTFLATVPVCPFEARPLRYKVTGDRLAISCRAEHPKLHQCRYDEFDDPETPGVTVGVQLWLPPSRALPPKPKEPEPEHP